MSHQTIHEIVVPKDGWKWCQDPEAALAYKKLKKEHLLMDKVGCFFFWIGKSIGGWKCKTHQLVRGYQKVIPLIIPFGSLCSLLKQKHVPRIPKDLLKNGPAPGGSDATVPELCDACLAAVLRDFADSPARRASDAKWKELQVKTKQKSSSPQVNMPLTQKSKHF